MVFKAASWCNFRPHGSQRKVELEWPVFQRCPGPFRLDHRLCLEPWSPQIMGLILCVASPDPRSLGYEPLQDRVLVRRFWPWHRLGGQSGLHSQSNFWKFHGPRSSRYNYVHCTHSIRALDRGWKVGYIRDLLCCQEIHTGCIDDWILPWKVHAMNNNYQL